jgi:mRNA interferase MazF
MKKGDIVLSRFLFSDLSGSKIRHVLMLYKGGFDTIVAFISTQLNWNENNDMLLIPDNLNGLKKNSIVKLTKLCTLDKSLLLGKLEKIDEKTHTEIDKKLKNIFKF